jgi:hypothetical protein
VSLTLSYKFLYSRLQYYSVDSSAREPLLSENVHIHVCDLDPIDNSLGYGPLSLLADQPNEHAWNKRLRDEPWNPAKMTDSYTENNKSKMLLSNNHWKLPRYCPSRTTCILQCHVNDCPNMRHDSATNSSRDPLSQFIAGSTRKGDWYVWDALGRLILVYSWRTVSVASRTG